MPCSFQNFGNNTTAIFFGETSMWMGAIFYDLIDHNTITGTNNVALLFMVGAEQAIAPPALTGAINNMFVEDNTMTSTSLTNAGHGCTDGWGEDVIVWSYNTTTNCLATSYGTTTHGGGLWNFELKQYNNAFIVNAGAVAEGIGDCYRCFHHQGSGEFLVFKNAYMAFSGKSHVALSMTHYRSGAPGVAGYFDPPGRCDGRKSIDGNRSGCRATPVGDNQAMTGQRIFSRCAPGIISGRILVRK